MEALVEMAIAIVAFVAEMTIYCVVAAVFPLRYAFSASYREKKRVAWHAKPYSLYVDLIVAGLAWGGLICAAFFWRSFFGVATPV